ncbi:hypothetical protein INS49_001170 [Diaporthe citri]|uniref:uncharacterized protein n=1 Tax=Diaporthe citri TaxID=83186 RepID=UPI001C80D4C1|nr:uncharacterized protein INS49_001170 [Diaporthe citri]KAG6366989.1 hypothetical protein INS49_001170 [Diaporthe citri]
MGEEHRWFTPGTSRVPTEKETEVFKQRVQSLAVMYGTVERFVKDIRAFSFNTAQGQQESLQKLDFSNPPDDPTRWPSLSASEQIRLHRGLSRYELCCRLLGTPFMLRNCTAFNVGGYSDDDPHWIVKELMPSWELQEIVARGTLCEDNSDESLDRGAIKLQELGWVYWEDPTRISSLRLPRDDDGKRRPEYQLARHFADDVGRPVRYEVDGRLDQVKGVHITTENWNNIIVPEYGFRAPDGAMDSTWIEDIFA